MSYFEENRAFGVVTVMDLDIYEGPTAETLAGWATMRPSAVLSSFDAATPEAKIDHLQVVNLNADGPEISIQGGKSNNILLKYGKSMRCEMTDALGQADALVALGGAVLGANGELSITEAFPGPKTLIGKTFVVDQKTGRHVPMKVIMYQFLPDAIPSFAFDSGNAATFDLNGDLLATELLGGEAQGVCQLSNGYFYSLVPEDCTIPEGSDD